ncbi:MAG TPA: alpha/beta hydrolase domain-containing protein, partial [Myxococcales bacterium]|nr:alpha/beta hydrolase domain-containing protein [Myxococcales bacterium]
MAGLAVALLAFAAEARITRIVIDRTTPLTGQALPYQQLVGRAFGEIDPRDPHNQIITDIDLGKDADGKVRYVTSFQLTLPVDMTQSSGFMWHDVPNRGGRLTIVTQERALGDVGLSSGWQADNAGATAVPSTFASLVPVPGLPNNEWVEAPVAVNRDGSSVTGFIQGRIVNRSGPNSAPLNVMANPIPFLPASLDTSRAVLRTRFHETIDGNITEGTVVPSSDWAFAHCDATHPFPGVPQDLSHASLPGSLPVHVCLKNGFNAALLYELSYAVKDPYVEGVGFAAFRDLNSFFKTAAKDDFGNANPVAGAIHWSVMRGVSQSGNATRAFIQLGFNQDESGRKTHEGAWPIIAGRRVSMDSRWAQPDGVLELYQMGSEGPQWWSDFPDHVRGQPTASILDRCRATGTCPNVIEHFGGSEVFALKMTTEWVGTAADTDIPLPANVRRYYVSSSTHGGGSGAMTQNSAVNGAGCPGNNWGTGAYRANPMPETQLVNVLRLAMRNWLMHGTPPPDSVWPRLSDRTLVDPTIRAMGQPHGIPAIPETVFSAANFVNPVFQYQWGPFFDETDATGVPTDEPPNIEKVIKMKIPRVDGDGNEVGGVPTVLRDAPLATYLGWNLTPTGFHEGQVCNYVGGMVPFAVTKAQRTGPQANVRFHISANGQGGKWSDSTAVAHDPRPSLEERYGTHAGYVSAVTASANAIASKGYLLAEDATALIAQAQASDVLVSTTNTSLAAFGEVNIGTGTDGSDPGAGLDDLRVHAGDTLQVGYAASL